MLVLCCVGCIDGVELGVREEGGGMGERGEEKRGKGVVLALSVK